MKALKCLFISLFILFGCSKEKQQAPESLQGLTNVVNIAKQEPEYELTFTFEKAYGKSEDVIISYLYDFEVTTDGRVVLADYTSKTIHIFNDSNKYLGSLGSEGLGPGEFQSITDMKIKKNKLHVFDRIRFMIHVFDLDTYTYLHSDNARHYPRNDEEYEEIAGWIPMYYHPLYNGKALSGFLKHPRDSRTDRETFNIGKERMVKYYPSDYDGNIIADKYFELKDFEDLYVKSKGKIKSNNKPQPYLGQSFLVFGSGGKIYTAWSKDFLIKQYSADGRYLKSFYYQDFPKRKINRRELKKIVPKGNWNRPLIEHAELPEYWPALYIIEVDDKDRVWVASIQQGTNILQWKVISSNGNLIAAGEILHENPYNWLRRSYPVVRIKENYLYIIEKSAQSGVSHVSKYKFSFQ